MSSGVMRPRQTPSYRMIRDTSQKIGRLPDVTHHRSIVLMLTCPVWCYPQVCVMEADVVVLGGTWEVSRPLAAINLSP